jgi:hypothetical protein
VEQDERFAQEDRQPFDGQGQLLGGLAAHDAAEHAATAGLRLRSERVVALRLALHLALQVRPGSTAGEDGQPRRYRVRRNAIRSSRSCGVKPIAKRSS